ncbi:CaiB/BaiF CoA transferase family protein [Vulcanimicrobium alpinum]|uniref:CaiB/BaiF CoA transferase family protein n=1 Tax=Vulcanimicrobium alpinum TaxID=3016050 RepID=UPI0038686F6B
MSDGGLPLAGITVVAIEQAVAAPFATRQLADMGARVIKIERPDGGDFARGYDASVNGLSSFFVWLNRGKESVAVDLKAPGAARILDALLARADVFVQNLAPGAAERLGLGAAELRARYPALIACSVTGYGDGGPYGQKKAYDLLVQAESGLPAITGDAEPAKVGISICDIAAGMYAFSSILLALFARTSGGAGASLSVSLFDALAEWMSAPAYATLGTGREPPRTGLAHNTIYPYGAFRCGDGGRVMLAVQNDREWAALCAGVLGRPELARDPRFATNVARNAHRSEIDALIEAAFAGRTRDEAGALLERNGIASSRANSVAEFLEHPQLRERGRWSEVDTPAGRTASLLPPFSGLGTPAMGPVPALGEHTARVFEEFGLREPA